MLSQWKLILIAVLVAVAGVLAWRLDSTLTANAALSEANTGLAKAVKRASALREREHNLAVQYAQEVQRLKKNKREADARINDALEQDRAWADQPVPSGVRDALRVR